MTRWLQAAKAAETPRMTILTILTKLTKPTEIPVSSVLSVLANGALPLHARPDGEAVKAQSLCTSTSGAQLPSAVVIHLSRGQTSLPTHPATCAVCVASDWMVCMRDAKGRTTHVGCWKAWMLED